MVEIIFSLNDKGEPLDPKRNFLMKDLDKETSIALFGLLVLFEHRLFEHIVNIQNEKIEERRRRHGWLDLLESPIPKEENSEDLF